MGGFRLPSFTDDPPKLPDPIRPESMETIAGQQVRLLAFRVAPAILALPNLRAFHSARAGEPISASGPNRCQGRRAPAKRRPGEPSPPSPSANLVGKGKVSSGSGSARSAVNQPGPPTIPASNIAIVGPAEKHAAGTHARASAQVITP
jgi:hypothetical protein